MFNMSITTGTLRMVIVLATLAPGVAAGTYESSPEDCFVQLERDTRVGDSLTVYTADNKTLRGIRPNINFFSPLRHLKIIIDPNTVDIVTIPFEDIDRIVYRKQSNTRWAMAILGFGIGGLIGGSVGQKMDPRRAESGDLEGFMIGAAIGGLLGAVSGYEVGKNHTVKVILDCPR